jgi:hypothetical protein
MTDLATKLAKLSDAQLATLERTIHAPRAYDLADAITRELAARHRRKRDSERFPVLLQEMAGRMRGDEDVAEISEAQKLALVLYRPDSEAAQAIAERAQRKELGLGRLVPRRRFRAPEPAQDHEGRPDASLPALPVPYQPPGLDSPAATPRAAPGPSNVLPFPGPPSFTGKMFHHGRDVY